MKRWLLRICVFLLLGAIVNVAVAWGISAQADPQALHEGVFAIPFGENSAARQIEVVHFKSLGWQPTPDDARYVHSLQTWNVATFGLTRRLWMESEEVRASQNADRQFPPLVMLTRNVAQRHVAGWPCGSLLGEGWNRMPSSPNRISEDWQIYWACVLDDPASSWGWRRRPLLLHPIWPRFAINTVFYAGILWLLFAAPFVLRRRRRIKRACARSVRIRLERARSAPSAARR
jgi:hypothetical protein